MKFNMKHHYGACAEIGMKEVRYQKEKYSKDAVCAKKLLGYHKENYVMPVTEENEHRPVCNIREAKNCLIMINVSLGSKRRLQQGKIFKNHRQI